MQPQTRVNESTSQAFSNHLSKLFAEEYVLYIKTTGAYWNIEGTDFYKTHRFFQHQFEQIDDIVENVKERIRSLTRYAYATLKSFLMLDTDERFSQTYLKELLTRHEIIIEHCKENVKRFGIEHNDSGTDNFITQLIDTHEKMAWFIRTHLI